MAIKPQILQSILADADTAKPVSESMNHSYTMEEYSKIMAKNRAMGMLNDTSNGGVYQPNIGEGDVEFDVNGNLRKIKRTAPMLIDLNRYTANRYMVDRVSVANKSKNLEPGTYIVCVFGEAIVKAISANTELPKTVKAFRFKKATVEETASRQAVDEKGEVVKNEDGTPKMEEYTKNKTEWQYVRSEFIPNDKVYAMTGHLNAEAAMTLMGQIGENTNSGDDYLTGDGLNDIA